VKIKAASDEYLEKAKQLTEEETERVMSRLGKKLHRKNDKDELTFLEVIAIQLELEDEQLREWREVRKLINK
jgi:hypothetical protein